MSAQKAFQIELIDSNGKRFYPKNRSELLVAEYFLQNGHHFVHEPFGSEKRENPDFLATVQRQKVLVEVKELAQTALDKRLKRMRAQEIDNPNFSLGPGQPFIINPKEDWATLREDVRISARQLLPHTNKVDYCLVLIGFCEGMFRQPDVRDLYATIFGDQRFQIQPDGSTRVVHTPSGALLKKKPERQHVSGVGFIKSQRLNDDDIYYQANDSKTEWPYIHAVSNPFAQHPLPGNLLTSRWDRTDLPG